MEKPLNNSLGTKEAKVKPECKESGNYFLPFKIINSKKKLTDSQKSFYL
jgi:hypothetical protein